MMNRFLLLFILAGNSCCAASHSDDLAGSAVQCDLQRRAERIIQEETRTSYLFRIVNDLNVKTTHSPFKNVLRYIAECSGGHYWQVFTIEDDGETVAEGTLEIFQTYHPPMVKITTRATMLQKFYNTHSPQWVGREEGNGVETIVAQCAGELPNAGAIGIKHRAHVSVPLFKALLDLKKGREAPTSTRFAVMREHHAKSCTVS